MTFEWVRFLQSHRIEFATEGPNIGRGNIGINCPFCKTDTGHHLGISLNGLGWNCWKNKNHHGRNPAPLISALIGCSYQEAAMIAGLEVEHIPEDWHSKTMAFLQPSSPTKRAPTKLQLLSEFIDFGPPPFLPSALPYVRYLKSRGIPVPVAREFGVKYCRNGPFRYRIILPVHFERKLVGWTGRTIADAPIRYKSLTWDKDKAAEDELTPAPAPINDYLLWWDHLKKAPAHTLILCEGPMDSLKINALGRNIGVVSTCFFGAEPTGTQIELLYDLAPRFNRTCVLLDQGAEGKTGKVAGLLRALGVRELLMPRDRKDPGELRSTKELLHILNKL